jgi:mono/diheme cytochrome c family protein
MRNLIILFAAMLLLTGCQWSNKLLARLTTVPSPAPVIGDAERGERIFRSGVNDAPPCISCHQIAEGSFGFSLGPNLAGIPERAGNRVDGLTAEEYIHESIVDPRKYVVSGYNDIMYPDFRQHFSDQDIADLIAYLMTL